MASGLPYGQVDSSLRSLAGQAEGFGRFAIGGLHGAVYCVTSLADNGPGSLREGCGRLEPLWMGCEVSGTVELASPVLVSSYKTIDGRGQMIKLTRKGLKLKECENVIICNIIFEGGRGHDADGIQMKPNSRYIWIDRCSLSDYDDGLVEITRGSTDITVSRCYFANHNKTFLIGADPSHTSDRCIRVTIHHCFFDGTQQRHPRIRFGKVHLYNNYTRNWGIYAVCASVESQVYSEGNIYEAGEKKVAFRYYTEKAADNDQGLTGWIKSKGDILVGETEAGLLPLSNECCTFDPSEYNNGWTLGGPMDGLRYFLQHCTGWQYIQRPADMPTYSLGTQL